MLCFSYLPYPLQSYYVLFYFKNSLDFFFGCFIRLQVSQLSGWSGIPTCWLTSSGNKMVVFIETPDEKGGNSNFFERLNESKEHWVEE